MSVKITIVVRIDLLKNKNVKNIEIDIHNQVSLQ